MERIELFDNYINNQLSDALRSEFDAKLKSDEEFASDFKAYLFTVDGICREAHQDNLDFGLAMKSLSKEKLKEIIGKQYVALPAASYDYSETEEVTLTEIIGKQDVALSTAASADSETEEVKPRVVRLRPWMWQAASIVAVIVIAFTVVYKVEQNSRNNVYDAIYACADVNYDLARSGGKKIDITTLSDDELKAKLTELVSIYNSSHSDDDVADNGTALAMSYIRLHDADKAKEVLNGLISRFKNNEEYADYVKKWETILNLLK